MAAVLLKFGADPLLFLPTFYIFKEAIQSRLHMPDFSTVRCPLR